MGKNKKKVAHSRKEEQQAKRVMIALGAIALALMVLMFVTYSYLG